MEVDEKPTEEYSDIGGEIAIFVRPKPVLEVRCKSNTAGTIA